MTCTVPGTRNAPRPVTRQPGIRLTAAISFSWRSKHPIGHVGQFLHRESHRRGEPDGRGDVDGAAATSALLSPARDDGVERDVAAQDERAGVDRSADLVRADRDHVRGGRHVRERAPTTPRRSASVWVTTPPGMIGLRRAHSPRRAAGVRRSRCWPPSRSRWRCRHSAAAASESRSTTPSSSTSMKPTTHVVEVARHLFGGVGDRVVLDPADQDLRSVSCVRRW